VSRSSTPPASSHVKGRFVNVRGGVTDAGGGLGTGQGKVVLKSLRLRGDLDFSQPTRMHSCLLYSSFSGYIVLSISITDFPDVIPMIPLTTSPKCVHAENFQAGWCWLVGIVDEMKGLGFTVPL